MVIYAGSVFSWQFSGVFGNKELQIPLADEGHGDLQLRDECTHAHTHKFLHISKAANPKQCTITAGNPIVTHFLPAETLLTGPGRNSQR